MTGMDKMSHLLEILGLLSEKYSDGHLTILRFTTNWRIGLGTPEDVRTYGVCATSFEEAALYVIRNTIMENEC